MKRVVRIIVYIVMTVVFWPFFMYKKYGNTDYKIKPRTIIIANHYSNWDPWFIQRLYGFKTNIRYLAAESVKKKPITRIICWAFDCIYVSQDIGKNLECVKEVNKTLKNDGVVMLFPEGFINEKKNGFLEFKPSFFKFAKKNKAYILPIYIYPQLDFLKKNKVYIGEELGPEFYDNIDDPTVGAMKVESKIMDYSFECRGEEVGEQHII